MDYFWMPMRTRQGRKAFLHFAKNLDNQELMEIENNLKLLDIPVLLIRGNDDPFLSSEITNHLHHDLPNSQLIKIPRAGHFIQEDQPDILVDVITQFFKETRYEHG
jgi:pimeloyl-ACP methyl ester carboxylesterase